jgi:hypothetical protein
MVAFKTLKRLRPSKSVGLHDIPGFAIWGLSDTFAHVLKIFLN